MRKRAVVIAAFTLLAAGSTASAEVQLTIQNGRVSLVAKDATLREILAEWARVGQTRIVNVERVPGGPVTLQLTNVLEDQALETLLRPLSGYVAAPRPIVAAHLSRFDRILVMPTIAPPVSTTANATTTPPAYPQPGVPMLTPFQQPAGPVADDQDEDRPVPPTAPRGPAFNNFLQPQVINPMPQSVPSATPGVVTLAPGTPGTPGAAGPPQTISPVMPAVQYPGTQGTLTVPGAVSVPGMIAQPPPGPAGAQQPKRPGGDR